MKRFCFCLLAFCLCVLAANNAEAQSEVGFKGVGLEVGFVNPENIDATFGLGAFADFGTITPQIKLETYLDYWSKSEEEFGMKVSFRDIAVGGKVKYLLNVSSNRIHPFVGGGIGIHFLNAEISFVDQNIGGFIIPGMSVSDSSTKLGLDLGGGFNAPVSPKMDFLTEMWIGIVSDVNQFSLKVGVLYNLGS
jgi:opacity protein-like surface antigen